ncbi:MAG TPA: hypothetical protein VMM36_15735 [Opitutaceae bacterium]|nr:hypothetical protein [Opitutaceae bacterium]
MKMKSFHPFPILLASAGLLIFAGCSSEKPGDVSGRTGDPQTPGIRQDALTSFGFDRRDEFAVQFKAMHSEFAAQLREYEAKNPDSNASDRQKAAMAEVMIAEGDFKHKLDAVSTADANSWNTARDTVTASWERLQAAFGRIHATSALPSQGL